jgi:hypothetical protein
VTSEPRSPASSQENNSFEAQLQRISSLAKSLADRVGNHSGELPDDLSLWFTGALRQKWDQLIDLVSEYQGQVPVPRGFLVEGEPTGAQQLRSKPQPPARVSEGGESHGKRKGIETLAPDGDPVGSGGYRTEEKSSFETSGPGDSRTRQDRTHFTPRDTPSPDRVWSGGSIGRESPGRSPSPEPDGSGIQRCSWKPGCGWIHDYGRCQDPRHKPKGGL